MRKLAASSPQSYPEPSSANRLPIKDAPPFEKWRVVAVSLRGPFGLLKDVLTANRCRSKALNSKHALFPLAQPMADEESAEAKWLV